MVDFLTTIGTPIDIQTTQESSNYSAFIDGLNYDSVSNPLEMYTITNIFNYKLAFSTETPTQRPSIGQLWPRGAGNRI